MLKLFALLLVSGACILLFYGKGIVVDPKEEPSQGKHDVFLPESANLEHLQNVLPGSVFKKLVKPFLEKNRDAGLTAEERDIFLDELEKIGDALGGRTKSTVAEIIDRIDPGRKNKSVGGKIRKWVGEKAEDARESMPSWGDALKGTLRILERGTAFLLNKAADLLEGK